MLNEGLTKFCESVMRRAKGMKQSSVMLREILGARWAYYFPFPTISDAALVDFYFYWLKGDLCYVRVPQC